MTESFPILNPASPGYFAGAPYGDLMEVTGPPQFIFVEEPYTEFFRTDARSVLITIYPHHYNFIPNPAFRTGLTNWEVTGATATINAADYWVGQSVALTGTGTVRYRHAPDSFVYVGPVGESVGEDWNQHGRSGPQWTFSAFFKGRGRVRLVMDAYSSQGTGPDAPPFGVGIPEVVDPSIEYYDAAKPYLLDPDGKVWMLRPEPYYQDLGRPPVYSDPSTVVPVIDKYILDAQAPPHLWMADGQPAAYIDMGPVVPHTDDPAVPEDDPSRVPPPATQGSADYLLVTTPTTLGDLESAYANVVPDLNEVGSKVVGNRFRLNTDVQLTAIRFYRSATETAFARPVCLYSAAGTLLWSGSTTESAAGAGWIEVAVPPMELPAGEYIAAYDCTVDCMYMMETPVTQAATDETPVGLSLPPSESSLVTHLAGRHGTTTGVFPDIDQPDYWYATDVVVQQVLGDPYKDGHVWGLISDPYYYTVGGSTTMASMASQWFDLNNTDWERLFIQTQARYSDNPAFSFGGCRWIDARIEVEDAEGLLLSAVMLDPTEHPVSEYFDGGMVEDAERDDFMWGIEDEPDNCVSEYYYDRIARVTWMWQNIQYFVPVGRPYQIFFGSYERPYEATGKVVRSTRNLTR